MFYIRWKYICITNQSIVYNFPDQPHLLGVKIVDIFYITVCAMRRRKNKIMDAFKDCIRLHRGTGNSSGNTYLHVRQNESSFPTDQ